MGMDYKLGGIEMVLGHQCLVVLEKTLGKLGVMMEMERGMGETMELQMGLVMVPKMVVVLGVEHVDGISYGGVFREVQHGILGLDLLLEHLVQVVQVVQEDCLGNPGRDQTEGVEEVLEGHQ